MKNFNPVALLLSLCLAQILQGADIPDARPAAAVLHYHDGLKSVLQFVETRPDLFPAQPLKASRLLPRNQKEEIWTAWKSFLDYILALDSLQAAHKKLPRLGHAEDRQIFLVRYGAFLTQYRWSLELITRLNNDPSLNAILNEPVPEVGLPAGTFDRLKFRFLNLVPAHQFMAMTAIYNGLGGQEEQPLRALIKEDEAFLWKAGHGKGEALTFKNGLHMLSKAGFSAWFPVQSGVSEWMGDTKVWRVHKALITPEQIEEMRGQLQPGDILLERREWYLSNIGLPGYWPHAALYVGSPQERSAYFGADVPDLETKLRKESPQAYADSQAPFEGHTPVVLEAMSEGVVFTSLEHSGAADSLVVLRPRSSKQEKAQALLRAFHYAGRPYDFNFDFLTDSTLVCSELVYKAYEPSPVMKGLKFTWAMMLGRPVSSPNMMVQQFDADYETPAQQTDFVLFLDGNERTGQAHPATIDEFRQSWKRPKWHVFAQGKA